MLWQYIIVWIIIAAALTATAVHILRFFSAPATGKCSGCSGCAVKDLRPRKKKTLLKRLLP